MTINGESLVQQGLTKAGRDAVVLDVGAHFGEWTLALLRQAGRHDLQIHCFEPSVHTFLRLRDATRPWPRVQCHQMALGDEPGEAHLNVVHAGAGSNSLLPTASNTPTEREAVRVDTVDRFCTRTNIASLALLKVDAEGFDLRVMRGAAGMLSAGSIAMVQFEYNHRWVHDRSFLKDAFDLFLPLGYSIGKITPQGIEVYEAWHPELETFREANFLAFREEDQPQLRRLPWWGP